MTTPIPQDYALEPVAVVARDFLLLWIGSGPIAPLIERHGLKIGSLLYAAPQSGWLPIESAPKDFVTEFDGWNGKRIPDVTWAHPEDSAKDVYDWCTSEYVTNWGYQMERVRGLTHWMPKPPPPPSTKKEPT